MAGQRELVEISDNGELIVVSRGKKGAAIVNIGTLSNSFNLPTTLPDGVYKDVVYGKEFKVKKGRISGLAGPERSYIIQK